MVDKFIEWLDRAKSRVYGVYAFWLTIALSPIIFTSLFVDQNLVFNKTGSLKNEYIRSVFFDFSTLHAWLYCGFIIVFPFIMTRLTIWEFPKWFVNAAYEKEIEHQLSRDLLNVQSQNKLEDEKTKLIKGKTESTKALVEFVGEKEKLETKEENTWLKEYNDFKKTNLYNYFNLIPQSIYEHSGQISVSRYNTGKTFEIPTELVSYADGNGLISVNVRDRTISLTDKGKFFMTQYQKDKK